MEAYELAQKFKENTKTQASYEEVVKWCGENSGKLDLTDENQHYLFEMATRYLMKIKIGHWNKTDSKVIINYFARTYASKQGIDKDVSVEIFEASEYRERFSDNSSAICVSQGEGKSEVVYSSRVVDNLTSNDTLRFIRGLQTIFHEVVHSKQYSEIYKTDNQNTQYNGNSYKIALETIVQKGIPQFYKENYSSLIREYQAELFGLEQAIQVMRTYYKQDILKDYDLDTFLNEMLKIDGKDSYDASGKVDFEQKNINASAMISYIVDKYVGSRPETINEIPVLKFGYNPDGSKKGIIQLIQDRAELISGNTEFDIQSVDDLYKTIANYGPVKKDEMIEIYEYITGQGIEDEFVYDLLQYRLEKTNWSPERVNQFMQQTRQDIARIIQEREEMEPEKKRPEEETFRDVIGDENEGEQKREGEDKGFTGIETMQWFSERVTEIKGYPKKQESVIKAISIAERQKIEQENGIHDHNDEVRDG